MFILNQRAICTALDQVKKTTIRPLLQSLVTQTIWIPRYYLINELIWQDGFLIDFLQKKLVDKWVRKFVIFSGYLYSERHLFDFVVRFYLDFVLVAGHYYSLFEFNNVASTLLIIAYFTMSFFLGFGLIYVYCLFMW